MNPFCPRLPAVLLLAVLFLPWAARAQEAPASNLPSPDDQALQKVSGIFDTDLPKTEKKGRIRLIVHPHLGDFTRRPYVRVPLGIRWGVNDHVELSATVEPYLEHGLRRGSPGNGLGDVEFGGKYAFHRWLQPDFDASVGANLRFPVDHPPLDMTDGYNHYAPYFVVAHQSRRIEGLKYFASTTLDYMDKSSVAGSFRKDDPHSTNMIFGTGFVLDRYPYHYTLETGYQTTSLVGRDNKQFVYVRPGFAWDIPRRYTFDSHGRWLIGVSFKITEGPDGTRIDSGGKLRGEFSLRRWFGGQPR
ncbi:MAG TPA: hypothetical protein VHD61_07745 [Lacunisphaera sp.]|nr:hypothetical protein [Lacunisphaera sp.]